MGDNDILGDWVKARQDIRQFQYQKMHPTVLQELGESWLNTPLNTAMDRSTELITSPVDMASPEPQKNSLGRESSLKRYDR